MLFVFICYVIIMIMNYDYYAQLPKNMCQSLKSPEDHVDAARKLLMRALRCLPKSVGSLGELHLVGG